MISKLNSLMLLIGLFFVCACQSQNEDYYYQRIASLKQIQEIEVLVNKNKEIQLIYLQTNSCNSCNLVVLNKLDSLQLELKNAYIIVERGGISEQSISVRSRWANKNRQIELELSEIKKSGILFGKHFVANFNNGKLLNYHLF